MNFQIMDVSDIKGFYLGNAEDIEAGTGCTVIICEEGAVAGVDVRGGAPATRETDLLKSENSVQRINAVVISGGSSYGLEAASGVMNYLERKGVGFKLGNIRVPIVCGASLFDLTVGRSDVRPDREMGEIATDNAYFGRFFGGNYGAGTGTTVGKIFGMDRAMKTGLGTFACKVENLEIGAIAAVNAVGDVYDGENRIIAGPLSEDKEKILSTMMAHKDRIFGKDSFTAEENNLVFNSELNNTNIFAEDTVLEEYLAMDILENEHIAAEEDDDEIEIEILPFEEISLGNDQPKLTGRNGDSILPVPDNTSPNEIQTITGDIEFGDYDDMIFNTTISCVITNAKFSKPQANKLASILHDAYARAIKPVHSSLDGDTIFVMTTNEVEVDFDSFAALSTDILQYAIIDSARNAKPAYGLKSARSFK